MTAIISAAGLADETAPGRPAPVLLDVRWELGGPPGRPAYAAGHLPGAVYVDLDTELAGPPGAGGRHPLPDLAVFGAAMRRAGVRRERPVVVYDGGQGWAAARAWWLLRYTGHPSVRVLDGGLAAWTGPLTTDVPAPAEGDFSPEPGGLPLLDADGAAALARRGVLLDARAAERYRGEVEPVDPVAGHIPGALSAPTSANVTGDGRLRTADELARRFAALGAEAGAEVGVYCGSGVSAAHEVLALTVAGVDAALYAGSWSHWSADPRRPVATGPGPG
ncbi:sulfurtransferase [Streptomyces sp. TRM 70351]|uniref:sulfurtransferase n=1 Tax=Streptomyces sp. TRM 70351 TaxID=3116552 RepID=UPI002E7BEAD9|nr:sulfurtransferase [Streptomyces sp. TRM 70351]MEE1926657.1 sulfurtransferase [Streptomyces sp. TRM 70351]